MSSSPVSLLYMSSYWGLGMQSNMTDRGLAQSYMIAYHDSPVAILKRVLNADGKVLKFACTVNSS